MKFNNPTPPYLTNISAGDVGVPWVASRAFSADLAANQNNNGDLIEYGQPGDGTHRIRIIWNSTAQTMTYQIDEDYTGGAFTADMTSSAINGADNNFDGNPSRVFLAA